MVKKIERYADLFKATHGGITFSGGESMMQPAFVSRVFHAAKEMGVHTCLDTSGFLGRKLHRRHAGRHRPVSA